MASSATFSLSELRTYDGIASSKIYVALKGTVFDVSEKGIDKYGQGCRYAMFAGRDMSRSMACDVTEVKDVRDDLSDLTPDQRHALDTWFQKFSEKYPIVGKLAP